MDNDQIKNFLALIHRSPDQGDGWRHVSRTLWSWVDKMPTDLVEREEFDDKHSHAGRCRMTSEGAAVLAYR